MVLILHYTSTPKIIDHVTGKGIFRCKLQHDRMEKVSLSNNVAGIAAKREPNKYTGKRKLLGVATMHKSNMVPVWDEDSAIEIARMRRG